MQTKGYDQKIAATSFIGAMCVVLIHVPVSAESGSFSWWFYQMTANGFCRWAVPFFFAVAGYFLSAHAHQSGWWKTAVRKRTRTLLLPYVLWNMIFAVASIAVTVAANYSAGRSLSVNLLKGWDVLMYFGLHPLKGGAYTVCWFLLALFLFALVSPVLVWLTKRFGWWIPVILFGASFISQLSLPLNFNPGWMMCFAIGISARFYPLATPKRWIGGGGDFCRFGLDRRTQAVHAASGRSKSGRNASRGDSLAVIGRVVACAIKRFASRIFARSDIPDLSRPLSVSVASGIDNKDYVAGWGSNCLVGGHLLLCSFC